VLSVLPLKHLKPRRQKRLQITYQHQIDSFEAAFHIYWKERSEPIKAQSPPATTSNLIG